MRPTHLELPSEICRLLELLAQLFVRVLALLESISRMTVLVELILQLGDFGGRRVELLDLAVQYGRTGQPRRSAENLTRQRVRRHTRLVRLSSV